MYNTPAEFDDGCRRGFEELSCATRGRDPTTWSGWSTGKPGLADGLAFAQQFVLLFQFTQSGAMRIPYTHRAWWFGGLGRSEATQTYIAVCTLCGRMTDLLRQLSRFEICII